MARQAKNEMRCAIPLDGEDWGIIWLSLLTQRDTMDAMLTEERPDHDAIRTEIRRIDNIISGIIETGVTT